MGSAITTADGKDWFWRVMLGDTPDLVDYFRVIEPKDGSGYFSPSRRLKP